MSNPAPVEAQVRLSLQDRLTAGLNRIQARLSAIGNSLGVQRVGRALGDLGRGLSNLGPAFMQSTARLSGLTAAMGLGAGGAAYAAFSLANRAQALGDEIAKTSRQLGFGAEALQEWRYAAEMQGVSVETLESSLGIFSRRVGEAANGNQAYLKFFQDLGIGIRDASGAVRDAEDLFMDAAIAISNLESPAERSAAAMNLFGRSGMDMTRLFEAGADGMVALREEARLTGHVMSEAAAEFSEVYGDNVSRLTTRLEGLKTLVGVQLMPVLNDFVVSLTEWYDANQALIRSTLTEWAEKLSGLLEDLLDPTSELRVGFSELAESVTGFFNAIGPVVDLIGGPGMAAIYVLGAYVGGPLIVALTSLIPLVVKLGWALATTPIGWILGGLVALGASVYVLIQKWDEFIAYWTGLWGRVTDAFDVSFTHGILAALREFNPVVHIARGIDAVIEYFTGVSLLDAGTALIETLLNGLIGSWTRVGAWAMERAAEFGEWFKINLFDVGVAIVQSLWDGLKSMWGQVVTWFQDQVNGLTAWMPDWLKEPMGIEVNAATSGSTAGTTVGSMAPPVPTPAQEGYRWPWDSAPEGGAVETDSVSAGSVTATEFNVPEPIIANQPQSVDASVHVGTIEVRTEGMTPAQAQAMVQGAINNAAAQRQADTLSALND